MTLEEAIKHCKDVALTCTNKECALEHFQLLKWLQEYSNMLEKQGEETIPLKKIILNVWELGNYWKELTKGVCNTEYGRQLDYIVKHWKEGEHYIKSFEKQGEQNPAWSEDDEKIANNLISQLGNLCTRKLIKEETKDKYVNWIKSLKDRVQPKIEWSEEDERKYIQAIEALEDFGKFELADWLKEHKN